MLGYRSLKTIGLQKFLSIISPSWKCVPIECPMWVCVNNLHIVSVFLWISSMPLDAVPNISPPTLWICPLNDQVKGKAFDGHKTQFSDSKLKMLNRISKSELGVSAGFSMMKEMFVTCEQNGITSCGWNEDKEWKSNKSFHTFLIIHCKFFL